MKRHKIKRIQSILHRTGTYNICKTSLYSFDDKIYILDGDIISLAYSYKNGKSQ